jgi:glycosyltransferase involved in cell wall biosynthesis
VDDGSNFENSKIINLLAVGRELKLIRQENQGRLKARLVGIESARFEDILLIDSRVEIDPSALHWWVNLAPTNCENFTSHVNYRPNQWLFGLYWNCIERLAWIAYWIKPRHKVLNINNFEFYPKGTTCLISTRKNLLNAYEEITSFSKDLKLSNDDTLLLKKMAKNGGIVISPQYQSWYTPRSNFKDFIRHTYHRGKVFADGHMLNLSIWGAAFLGTWATFIFFILSGSDVINSKFALGLLGIYVTVSFFARFTIKHVICFTLVTPIFIATYSAGILRGALAILRTHWVRTG